MNGRRAVRFTAVMLGAVMLATIVPIAVPVAAAGAAPFAVSQARLYDNDGATYDDEFGGSVAIAGNLIAVGKPGYNADRGRVYIYKRTGTAWSYVQTLSFAGTQHDGDRFGDCLAMDGNTLVVGAPHAWTGGGPVGVALVYSWSGTAFVQQQQLSGETISAEERYGEAVAIDGNTIVVGAPLDSGGAGSVWPYVWNGSSWETQGTKFAAGGDNLGYSVDIAGDMIVASTPGYDVPPGPLVDAGAVAWFTRSGNEWTFRGHKFSPEPRAGDRFGGPLAIDDSGSIMIVGSPVWDADIAVPGDDTGRAWLLTYNGSTWNNYLTLANPGTNSPDGDNFGSAVAYDDGLALVGAYWDDDHHGAAYYYRVRANTATMVQKISEMGASPGESLLGASVAMGNGTAVVGAPTSGSAGPPLAIMPGSAFVYSSRATITGLCRDEITGLPVAGSEVTAYVPDMHGEPQMANAGSLMITGANGRYTFSVDSGEIYLGYMGMIPYQPGYYNEVSSWWDATPITVWAGNTYTYHINLHHPIGSVFRFYNPGNGTHFYTDSVAEAKHVRATWPHIFTYEGVAYRTHPATETQALYRFYNQVSRSHFYTASLSEANHIKATWPHIFTYDGPTYKVSPVPVGSKIPVYRFFNRNNGSHFFTASAAEANYVKASLAHVYTYEGPAFWIGQP